MTSAEISVAGRQAVRRQLVMMAGTLVLVLVVLNVVALYGLDRIHREAAGYAATTEVLIAATDEAREAQVAFKNQVHEWKNVLLRGHDPADLASYRAAFEAQQARVVEQLRRVVVRMRNLGMPAEAVDRILAQHAEIGRRYAEALAAFEPGSPEAVWRADRSIRGVDRGLPEAIDALVADVRALAEDRRKQVQTEMERVSVDQHRILVVAHGAGILLVLVSLAMALRAIRRR